MFYFSTCHRTYLQGKGLIALTNITFQFLVKISIQFAAGTKVYSLLLAQDKVLSQ